MDMEPIDPFFEILPLSWKTREGAARAASSRIQSLTTGRYDNAHS